MYEERLFEHSASESSMLFPKADIKVDLKNINYGLRLLQHCHRLR